MTDHELHVEAKRRTQKANPSLTDEQWSTWLAVALSRGASIVLQLDGCRAEYVGAGAPASKVRAAKGVP